MIVEGQFNGSLLEEFISNAGCKMRTYYKRMIQNMAIFFLLFVGIKNFVISLPLRHSPYFEGLYSRIDTTDTMFLQGRLAFVVSLAMVLMAFNLYKRIRSAWIGEIVVLVISIVLQAIYFHSYAIHMILLETLILAVLIASANDFSRRVHKHSLRKALTYIALSFGLLLLNTSLGLYIMRGNGREEIDTLSNAFVASFRLLLLMDKSVVSNMNAVMNLYADSIIVLYWACVFSALLFVLKPITIDYFKNKTDQEKAHAIVLKYGQNPMSYLAMEADKSYFFGTTIEGVCAYTTVGNVMVVCGDPICDSNDGLTFLSELMTFTRVNHYDLVFLNVTEVFLDLYKAMQFGCLKYGEDACFKLETYNLKGGAVAKVRAAINHANKMGIQVYEYKPLVEFNAKTEKEILEISSEWLKNKTMPEMQFMLGGVNLQLPRARRYFYAEDDQGVILGFVVFLPYLNGKAYLADVTRRRSNAPQGVLEKIIFDAFMAMKEEGVIYGNMGLSPLFNVGENESQSINTKVSAYIYENLNALYNFKLLHHSKEKFAPTHWESRYITYFPKPMTLKYAYAIVRAQNPVHLSQIIRQFLKNS